VGSHTIAGQPEFKPKKVPSPDKRCDLYNSVSQLFCRKEAVMGRFLEMDIFNFMPSS